MPCFVVKADTTDCALAWDSFRFIAGSPIVSV